MKMMCTELSQIDKSCIYVVVFFFLFSFFLRFVCFVLHEVAQNRKIGKPNNLIVLGAQDLWVLMICRSFFTPGRDIGSAIFIVWVLVQSRMLPCDSTVLKKNKNYQIV
jgi:hypothetical protein